MMSLDWLQVAQLKRCVHHTAMVNSFILISYPKSFFDFRFHD